MEDRRQKKLINDYCLLINLKITKAPFDSALGDDETTMTTTTTELINQNFQIFRFSDFQIFRHEPGTLITASLLFVLCSLFYALCSIQ